MITVCILTKNDEHFIDKVILSVKPYVQEIVVVDDHSVDNTRSIALFHGATVYELPFEVNDVGFAQVANWMLDQAKNEWILVVDSDELLAEPDQLQTLTRFPDKDTWVLPRRKWIKYPIERDEYEAYPDWQVRFFKNKPENRYESKMHVRIKNSKVTYAYRGPHIEHLQEECRTPEKMAQRKLLYEKLAAEQGVAVVGGHTLEK